LGFSASTASSGTTSTTTKKKATTRTTSHARALAASRGAASRSAVSRTSVSVGARRAPIRTGVVHYYGVPTYADSAKGDVATYDDPEIRQAAL